jgi:hypothetical protein
MAMTRTERRSAHKKQERLQVEIGNPTVEELKEGVPVIRLSTTGELAEYINFKGILYKKVYTIV